MAGGAVSTIPVVDAPCGKLVRASKNPTHLPPTPDCAGSSFGGRTSVLHGGHYPAGTPSPAGRRADLVLRLRPGPDSSTQRRRGRPSVGVGRDEGPDRFGARHAGRGLRGSPDGALPAIGDDGGRVGLSRMQDLQPVVLLRVEAGNG